MSAKAKKQPKSGGGFFINSVSAILILITLVLGMSVFFKVSEIEVSGISRYSASEVAAASGIKAGDNLVFLSCADAESRIQDELVYVGRVSVSRRLPNRVIIEVHESGTVACVESENAYWLIDNYCRILEECSVAERQNYIAVTGFLTLEPKPGSRMTVADGDKSKVEYLEDLLQALENANMLGNVRSIDMSTSGNPRLEYLDRFRVKLGQNDNIESKLALLSGAIDTLEPNSTGIFDLTEAKEAYFTPLS